MSRGPSWLVPLVAKKQQNNGEENQPANQNMLEHVASLACLEDSQF
jgi:hypothetical protein